MKFKALPFLVSLLLIIPTCFVTAQSSKEQAINQKIASVVKQLTLQEKIAMLHANGIFGTAGVPRLNIPGLMTDDGPLGVREDVLEGWGSANLKTDSATYFPNGSALAATWNPALSYDYGHAVGEEARARKKFVMLAPAFNIARTPLNGRTYEYLSEDPYLNARMAVQSVKGIQSQNIAACVKHYALNNQEIARGSVSVEIDERAMQEIYLPAFKATIMEGNAWTIMSAYNKLRGVYCSENPYLLKTILKEQWGFKGIVISDWGGTHTTVAAANNGLDLEMGSNPPYNTYYFADKLLQAVKEGKVTVATIDEKVSRILWVMYHTTMSENPPAGSINTAAHSKTAYDIATESIVLLKNEKNMLPLNTANIKSVAVIGDNAIRTNHLGGFGAGVKARYEITPLKGLENKLDKNTTIKFAQGYRAIVKSKENFNAIETSKADPTLIAEAAALAKSSELTILFVGANRDYESESRDRPDLSLPFGEQQLIDAVLAANPNTIIVVTGGAPYAINKIKEQSSTIVWNWYNGSENGNALADVLIGKVNPSGKMPFTFPAALNESPAHALNAYPGDSVVTYKEGILVGYRWFDTKKIAPLYPFGYGLSYTNYTYAGLKMDKSTYKSNETITATLTISNTGNYSGKEIVQLYVSKPNSAVARADKELKAFTKVFVNKAGKAEVKLTVLVKDLAYYDTKSSKWIVEPGTYKILVGSSSAQIIQTASITVQ
jgi:beta-glucosidase